MHAFFKVILELSLEILNGLLRLIFAWVNVAKVLKLNVDSLTTCLCLRLPNFPTGQTGRHGQTKVLVRLGRCNASARRAHQVALLD